MRLARDLRNLGQARGFASGADREDWTLPLVTLCSQVLVFGSLGRDTTGQRNVLEDRVVLSNSDVDLSILGPLLHLLLLLLALHNAVLGGGSVALVHVRKMLRVGVAFGLCLGPVGFLLDIVEVAVDLVDRVLDLLL